MNIKGNVRHLSYGMVLFISTAIAACAASTRDLSKVETINNPIAIQLADSQFEPKETVAFSVTNASLSNIYYMTPSTGLFEVLQQTEGGDYVSLRANAGQTAASEAVSYELAELTLPPNSSKTLTWDPTVAAGVYKIRVRFSSNAEECITDGKNGFKSTPPTIQTVESEPFEILS